MIIYNNEIIVCNNMRLLYIDVVHVGMKYFRFAHRHLLY